MVPQFRIVIQSRKVMLITFCFLALFVGILSQPCFDCPLISPVRLCYAARRYRIEYFSSWALYYSNTTASYSASLVTLSNSGDIEKNLGPADRSGEDSSTSTCNARKRSAPTTTGTENPSKRVVLAPQYCSPFDIGLYSFPKAQRLTNEEKDDIAEKCWSPEPSYNFPKTPEGKDMHLRSFKHEWLRLYPWLRYSRMYDGAFCLPCILFGNNNV